MDRHYAVIGSPIAHSLSPALHTAAYSQLGLDWSFSAIEVEQSTFSSFIDSHSDAYSGYAVTMPLKHDAFALATTHDFLSTATGSTNTLVRRNNSGVAEYDSYNTDVWGIVHALRDAGCRDVKYVTIVGSGATAASAIAAAADLGAEYVFVVARSNNESSLSQVAKSVGVSIAFYSFGDTSKLMPCDVLISTLPGNIEVSLSEIPRSDQSFLLDVAYSPWPSQRALEWEHSCGIAVSGLEMLMRQALIQVRIFVHGSPEICLPHESDVFHAMKSALSLS